MEKRNQMKANGGLAAVITFLNLKPFFFHFKRYLYNVVFSYDEADRLYFKLLN